jgi:hypothetical protein
MSANSPHKHQGLRKPGLAVPSLCTKLASIQRMYPGAQANLLQILSASSVQHIGSSIADEETVAVSTLQTCRSLGRPTQNAKNAEIPSARDRTSWT